MTWWEATILAVIEGLTEFLPVSSTGHMVLVSHYLQIQETAFQKAFMIIIQFAAVLSVVFIYFRRLLRDRDLYLRLAIAFLPAAGVGFLLKDVIDQWLERPEVVAWSLILGGLVFIWIDRVFKPNQGTDEVTIKRSIWVGVFQCAALIPGVSRSGATIVGGLFSGLNRTAAAEFSFLLAIPVMLAASALKLRKVAGAMSWDDLQILAFGCVLSFAIAWASVRFLLHFVTKYGFWHFGVYRIALGILVLLTS